MLHLRIWFVAHVFNLTIGLFVLGGIGLILAFIGFLFGLPLIAVFGIIIQAVRDADVSRWQAFALTRILFPTCTGIAAWLTLESADMPKEPLDRYIIIIPVIATIASVLAHAKCMRELNDD